MVLPNTMTKILQTIDDKRGSWIVTLEMPDDTIIKVAIPKEEGTTWGKYDMESVFYLNLVFSDHYR